MFTWNSNPVKVRQGLFKCPNCRTFYNPTNGGCPGCSSKRKPNNFYVSTFALIIVLFLSAMYIKDAGAQPECYWIDGEWVCISHIALTPLAPTSTPVAPTVTPTPTIVIQPHPTATPTQPAHIVYFPLIQR
jgi:hypothetical protein